MSDSRLRIERSEAAIGAMFGRLSGTYDLFNTWATGGLVHRWRRVAVGLAAPKPVTRVLDVACGTGDLCLELVPRAKLVVGLDFSAPMLSRAAGKVGSQGLRHRVQLVLANARTLPFPDGCFEGITVGFGVRNLVDLPGCLAEMVRVLRNGGRLAVLEIGRAETGWMRRVYSFYFTRLTPMVGSLTSRGQSPAFLYLNESAASFLSPPEMVLAMQKAGLAGVGYHGRYGGLIGFYWGIKMEGAA